MSEHTPHRSLTKGTAILLSVVFPGVGQIYLDQYKKGILFYLLALLFVIFPLIWVISFIDSIVDKKGIAAQTENPFSKRKKVLTVSILTAPVSLGFVLVLMLQGYSFLNDHVLAEGRTENELSKIEKSIIEYEQNYGRYPDSLEVLISIKPVRECWKRDYWNEAYYYTSNDSAFVLISPGKDRKLNTGDDLRRRGKVTTSPKKPYISSPR